MGIKNIHILFIGASTIMAIVFGLWGIRHNYDYLGIVSLILAIGLMIYGVMFLKKVRTL